MISTVCNSQEKQSKEKINYNHPQNTVNIHRTKNIKLVTSFNNRIFIKTDHMEGQNVNSTISKSVITYTKFSNCNTIKWKITRRQILYIFAYMWNPKSKTSQQIHKTEKMNRYRKQTSGLPHGRRVREVWNRWRGGKKYKLLVIK